MDRIFLYPVSMFRLFAPDAGEGGLDFFLEAGDQFAVGGDEGLLGFDLGDDGLLGGEGWEGYQCRIELGKSKLRNCVKQRLSQNVDKNGRHNAFRSA